MPKIKFTIITLFREAIEPYLNASMMWKAKEKGIVDFEFVNLRDFGLGPHKSVDDTPYGGGDGMLLRCEPVFAAIESVKTENSKVILPTPVGQTWNQEMARIFASGAKCSFAGPKTWASAPERSKNGPSPASEPLHYIILCPHYEGYDERILTLVDYKISLGNYVLTGGELPALIIIDSITRLLPGVLGGEQSAAIESFSDGDNLEYPQYTKPAVFRNMAVPEVLLSGNHGLIAKWRQEHSGIASGEKCPFAGPKTWASALERSKNGPSTASEHL
ncbi:tRNA (guanine(37)-N(1))-methyltransferase [Candidatus Saccharibacteria bacterium]|nr:tRNA (guanine(37)-N(1))-methyltransferase [Candidatus Saccharibacteria bacterium]